MDPIKIVLRPSPNKPDLAGLAPKVREYIEAQDQWAREVQAAVSGLLNALNTLRSQVGTNKTGTAWT